MHIDVIRPFRNMGGNILRNIPGTYRFHRKLHGKKAGIVFAEHLTVHEIPPAPDCLSQNQPGHTGVAHKQRILFFNPAVDEQCDKRSNDTAVNCQTAVSQLKYTQQIILIIIP